MKHVRHRLVGPTGIALLTALLAAGCNESILGPPDRPSKDGKPPRDTDRAPNVTQPEAVCAAEPNPAAPGDTVRLVGEHSHDPDGSPLVFHDWRLVVKPVGSAACLPGGDGAQANRDGFLPDLLGDYIFNLLVTDEYGSQSEPCSVTVTYRPDDALFVQLHTKLQRDAVQLGIIDGDDWQNDTVCTSADCRADFGAAGVAVDDPIVYLDDPVCHANGPDAPIGIGIPSPADGSYLVGVVDPGSLSGTNNEATVSIWIGGQKKLERVVPLDGTAAAVPVARVVMPGGLVEDLTTP